jgi:hypothetical protein
VKTSEPTDDEIRTADTVMLVDDSCDCWSVVVWPLGGSADAYDSSRALLIPIDSSLVSVIEAWHERIKSLKSMA